MVGPARPRTGRAWWAALVLAALAASCGPSVGQAEPPTVDPSDAVYRVVVGSCTGETEAVATGVAIAPGRIATVAHTFDDAASVTLYTADGTPVDAVATLLDDARDIALLDATVDRETWLPLGSVADGSEASVVTAAEATVEIKPATVVRQLDVTIDGVGLRAGLELDADIDQGDSGAPVIANELAVAGIVFATERDDRRGWAIAASEIEAALALPSSGPISFDC